MSAPDRRCGPMIGRCLSGLALCLLLLAGCDIPEPTLTPSPTIEILAPSATVNARPPSDLDFERTVVAVIGTRAAEYTPAAPSLVAGATVTPTPYPTQAFFPMSFSMADGLVIAGTYRGARIRPAPALLLLHGLGGSRDDWFDFAARMQDAGFSSLAIDLRGQGVTGGAVDWRKAQDDVRFIFEQLRALPGVDPRRVSVVGAGIGANLALVMCALVPECHSLVLLSPALDYEGVVTQEAMALYGNRPVLIAASRVDGTSGTDSAVLDSLARGDHRLLVYEGDAHGIVLLRTQPNLAEIVARWLGGS